jgi:4-hydroxy-tetrahydrodipicolinate synthase
MMTAPPLGGVLPVFQTPFLPSGGIDHAALETQFEWLFDNGADGVVFAMVSEVLRLSSEERDEVATLTCKLAAGRGASVISVGAESTAVAVRHAKHAAEAGATAVMATPPALFPCTDDELVRYFLAIAHAADLPLIVQDASGYVGASLSIEMQARLHTELRGRVMFKPEAPPIGPRLTELRDATDGEALVFEGTGGLYLIDSFRRGAIGTMPAGDLVWALAALWHALCEDDYSRAYRIAGPLALIVSQMTTLDRYVEVEKRLLVRQGATASSVMRGPTGSSMDNLMVEEIDRLFILLREAVDCV